MNRGEGFSLRTRFPADSLSVKQFGRGKAKAGETGENRKAKEAKPPAQCSVSSGVGRQPVAQAHRPARHTLLRQPAVRPTTDRLEPDGPARHTRLRQSAVRPTTDRLEAHRPARHTRLRQPAVRPTTNQVEAHRPARHTLLRGRFPLSLFDFRPFPRFRLSPSKLARRPNHPGPRTRALLLALTLLALLLALLTATLLLRPRPDPYRDIQARGAWRVGMDPSFPPFEFVAADGQAAGLDVDLARALGDRLGIRTELVTLGFDELVDAVAAHRVDAAISALPILPERTQDVRFSDPYAQAGVVLATRAGSSIRSPADLAGRTVAVEWGSQGDAEARRLNAEARRLNAAAETKFTLQPYDTVTAALDALASGAVDAAIVDAISLALHPRAADLAPVGDPLISDPYVVVLPADAPALLNAVNAALRALESDGTLDELRARWLRP